MIDDDSATAPKESASPPSGVLASNKASLYYKSMTFKVDKTRYERLKHAGIRLNKRSQDILTEALDHYLATLEGAA